MRDREEDRKRASDERSPLYTPKSLAKIKKAETQRDIDGAYRYQNRKADRPLEDAA